jgi:hypothetical protein
MKSRVSFLAPLFITITLCYSVGYAFDLFGPPAATLKEGWCSTNLEYLYSSMDVEADGLRVGPLLFSSDTIENIASNKFYVNFASGLTDDCEVYWRLGATDMDPDRGYNRDNFAGYIGDSDYEFAVGAGTKINFGQSEDGMEIWSLVAQASYASLDFDKRISTLHEATTILSAEADIWEAQVAVGYTYRYADDICFYCGPFLHFVGGEAEVRGTVDGVPGKDKTDLEEESRLGGYIGTEIGLADDLSLCLELQFTGARYALGGSLIWRLK